MYVLEDGYFDMSSMTDEEEDRQFRFTRAQILELIEELGLPARIVTHNRHVASPRLAMCLLLHRLATGMLNAR